MLALDIIDWILRLADASQNFVGSADPNIGGAISGWASPLSMRPLINQSLRMIF